MNSREFELDAKMSESEKLLELNQRLLDSITQADWETYQELCDPSLTAFEPEAVGQLVVGMDFHRFYFELGGIKGPHQTTMCSPNVRLLGETAVVSCIRLIQKRGADGPTSTAFEETRIWHKRDGDWRHVHFHRTDLPNYPRD